MTKNFAMILLLLFFTMIYSGCAVVKPVSYTTDDFFVDSQSNTMWVKRVSSQTTKINGGMMTVKNSLADNQPNRYQYREAVAFVGQLNGARYGGHNDWRLPTTAEMRRLSEIALLRVAGMKTKKKISLSAALSEIGYIVSDSCWTSDSVGDGYVNVVPMSLTKFEPTPRTVNGGAPPEAVCLVRSISNKPVAVQDEL